MTEPTVALVALRASTAALVQGVAAEQWTDADVRAPSLLPDWTRGHVLTHIARNADGITRAVSGALRGEQLERYPNGVAGRNADIEAGAGRSSAELAADVSDSADRLDRVFSAVADAGRWDMIADGRTASAWVLARWREVEIHRVDLGGSYTAADWPLEFVGYLLPELAGQLATRTEAAVRITVTRERSLDPALFEQSWSTGGDDAVVVEGPDWALLSWLIGRPAGAVEHLSALPEIGPWM